MFCGQIEFFDENDTTWPATQVDPRRVESGLGGHEAGVFGVEKGVENASLPLLKRERMALSLCATFSDLKGVCNQGYIRNQNSKIRHCIN